MDVNGKFKISDKIRNQYPVFAYIVGKVMPAMASNDNYVNAMSKFTGVSRDRVKSSLQSGQGPSLSLWDNSRFNGLTKDSKHIEIMTAKVQGIEREDADYMPNLEHKFAFMINLLTHELVQSLTMGQDWTNKNPGELFEDQFLGRHYNSETAVMQDLDPLKKQYAYEMHLLLMEEMRAKDTEKQKTDDEQKAKNEKE